MAEDWAKTVAKKVELRIAEEAERVATQRKRFEEGVERFRKQILDLVAAVNGNVATEQSRIQTIVLDNGLILAAAYKRIVTEETIGANPKVPASAGKVAIHYENRKGAAPEPKEFFITSSGTQTTFYHLIGEQLKIIGEADLKVLVEFFAS